MMEYPGTTGTVKNTTLEPLLGRYGLLGSAVIGPGGVCAGTTSNPTIHSLTNTNLTLLRM